MRSQLLVLALFSFFLRIRQPIGHGMWPEGIVDIRVYWDSYLEGKGKSRRQSDRIRKLGVCWLDWWVRVHV